MFSLFSKKNSKVPVLTTDLHSHLIPGIDDGAKDMQESMQLLKGLMDVGYEKIITTPHIMLDSYRNTRENIMEGLDNLKEEANNHRLDVVLEAAAEYYLDDGFEKHLESGKMLTLGENYILFETSYVAKPLRFEEMILAIINAGYKPILAHPERYRYVNDYDKEYHRMIELGILFQVNINSFGGHYGKDAQKKAVSLSKKGFISFLGSDIHHIKQIETLSVVKTTKNYRNIFKQNIILNHTL